MARGQTIEDWMRQTITDNEKGRCTAFSLVHMKGTVEKEIHTKQLGSKQWNLKELATEFRGRAESYAEDLSGAQMFQLLGFYDNKKEAEASKPYRIAGNTDHDGLGTEAPTGQGMVQQAMRHNEALMAMFTRQTSALFESSNKTIDLLTARNNQLVTENREQFEIIREMIMGQSDKRHEYRMTELNYQRASQERKALFSAAPALLNSLTGRDIFPQSSADSSLVDMLLEHVMNGGESMIGKLQDLNLPPKVMGALAGRLQRFMEQKKLEDHARQPNGMDPEEDATGGQLPQ